MSSERSAPDHGVTARDWSGRRALALVAVLCMAWIDTLFGGAGSDVGSGGAGRDLCRSLASASSCEVGH